MELLDHYVHFDLTELNKTGGIGLSAKMNAEGVLVRIAARGFNLAVSMTPAEASDFSRELIYALKLANELGELRAKAESNDR